jgi:hypothetical protein
MSTLTATPNNETGSVTLDILKTTDVAKVIRTNVNGSEEVRVTAGQLPSSATTGIVATNLAVNPSFETGLTGYTLQFPTFSSQSNPLTGGLFGSRTLRMTSTGASLGEGLGLTTRMTATLTGGKSYIVSVHSQDRDYDGLAGAYPQVYSGGLLTTTNKFLALADGWRRRGSVFTVPGSGAKTVDIDLVAIRMPGAGAAPAGSYVDFDGVMLEEVAGTGSNMGTYFDGDTADIAGFDYLWTGTAHASTSTLATVGGRLILTDYEAAHGLNSYNVYSADGSFVTASAELEIDKPWLSVPVMPQYSEQVETITAFGATREAATTVHRPLGRADSLVVMGKLGDRTGSLEVFCNSYADARRLERIFERGEIVQLRQRVEGLDMYFTATGIPVAPYSVQGEGATRWSLTIQYIEVRRPIGNLAGALGWTFDELASSFASFDAVRLAFTDFDALTLGDGIV